MSSCSKNKSHKTIVDYLFVEESRWATRDGRIRLAAAARVATLVPVPWVGLAADTTTMMTTQRILPPPKRDDNDDPYTPRV